MIERVKTGVLIFLIGASVFLTWQLWTFQPDYDYITSTEEVVRDTLAEEQDLRELLLPARMIYHEEEGLTALSSPGNRAFEHVRSRMEEWSFTHIRPLGNERYQERLETLSEKEGLHIYFRTDVPLQALAEVMDVEEDEFGDVSSFNRIWLFTEAYTEQVLALFISEQDQYMVQGQSNIDEEQFEEYLTLARTYMHMEVEMVHFAAEEEEGVFPVHYVPIDSPVMKEYRYFYNDLPLNAMIAHLFVDPSLVRRVEDQEGTFYTDGTRGLQNHPRQKTIHFFHPRADTGEMEDEREYDFIRRGNQYVNQHQGWETTYVLDEVEESVLDPQQNVQFRQLLQDENVYYPVYSESGEQDQHVIRLQIQADQVIGYYRPLYETDRIIDESEQSLPSGEQLIDHLEEKEIDLTQIKDMELGYKTEMADDYVHFIPHWIVRLQNNTNVFVRQDDLRGGTEE